MHVYNYFYYIDYDKLTFNPYPAELIYLNFQPLEVVWLPRHTTWTFKWQEISHICLISNLDV